MEVTESVFNWLKGHNLLKNDVSISENKFFLHELDSQGFESGLNFIPIIKRLYHGITKSDQTPTPISEINSLQDTLSTAAKLYN